MDDLTWELTMRAAERARNTAAKARRMRRMIVKALGLAVPVPGLYLTGAHVHELGWWAAVLTALFGYWIGAVSGLWTDSGEAP